MTRTVRASGTGEATARPDAAVVQLAVTHRAGDLADALAGAESARAEVVAAAHEHVPPTAVGSTGLAVHPEHGEPGQVVAYVARHGLLIACAGLEAAGQLVAGLADSAVGRLVVEGVTPEVSDPTPARDEARALAFAEARRRAAQLARLAGGELGEVQHVVEGAGAGADGAGARLAFRAAEVRLEPGETTVRATVTAEFELL
ncbi:SIMPL domain-containing protein [Nocardioides nanhaiensis]|uniref:DUF541 domain-containing protein n=1 Tax=Nocardioides nanhaiensis TaxID=1476871 RepID=A0ABP8WTM9_9ACTN